ncbi:MAG: ABC transporter substrate-binding protein [Rhodospirillaceae bacterium]
MSLNPTRSNRANGPLRSLACSIGAMAIGLGLALAPSSAAQAQDPVKIGLITTLSTGAGYLGEDVRDGFMLAVQQGNGTLGGVPVEVLVEDDERKPERGLQIAERFVKQEKTPILTGIIFSNVSLAVVPRMVREGIFYLSPNSGPSQLAGKGCHENFFNISWQNDNQHEAAGQMANNDGVKTAFILAPNYPAGKDALSGFKRFFEGEIVGEISTQLGQTDYAAELARIRDAQPEAVFYFLPGGMGINFLKQFDQAGLKDNIQIYGPAFSFDERLLGAVGAAAEGVKNASHWNWDFDNAANKAMIEAFTAAYDRPVTQYVAMGWDTAMLIGTALEATGGDVSNAALFRETLEKAEFESTRGAFRFNSNHFPVQNFYVREVVAKEGGGFTNVTRETILTDHQDAYVGDCAM